MKSHSNNINEVWWGIAVQLCPPIANDGQWMSIANNLIQDHGKAAVLRALGILYENKKGFFGEQSTETLAQYLRGICANDAMRRRIEAKQERTINSQTFIIL
jgi:hypothetical protein